MESVNKSFISEEGTENPDKSFESDDAEDNLVRDNLDKQRPSINKLQTFFINLQKFAHPWEHPTLTDVVQAIQKKFPDDPSMVVEAYTGTQKGVHNP